MNLFLSRIRRSNRIKWQSGVFRQIERYVLFDDDDDGDGADADDDDTPQHAGESNGEYEARLNGITPPSAHFCCRPVFS